MNYDLLLHWMTHMGDGSWSRFRRAVEALASPDADLAKLSRRSRVSLSDLGCADFFVDGTRQWRVLPPGLGGLAMQPGVAVLWGGRTPALVQAVEKAAEEHGCCIISDAAPDCPTCIHVNGADEAVAIVANETGIAYARDLAGYLSQSLTPIPRQLEESPEEPAPINWKVRSFDLRSQEWVDGLLPRSACEYSPSYGMPVYFLHKRRGRLLRMPKHEAVYASAMLQGIRLVSYDTESSLLSAPLSAPLPETYARIACLCSGKLAEITQNCLVYREVPPAIAAIILIAAAQPHPPVSEPVWSVRCANE